MKKETGIIVNNLLAAAEELELHATWLRTLAAMLQDKPKDISANDHEGVLVLAIESVAKQIKLTSDSVDGIGSEL